LSQILNLDHQKIDFLQNAITFCGFADFKSELYKDTVPKCVIFAPLSSDLSNFTARKLKDINVNA